VNAPRQKVTVTVTQRHIDKGESWSPKKDAVALALRDAGLRRWRSGFTSFTVGKFSKRVPMPDVVKEFVKQFDYNRTECKPFSFEVDLTQARL
jgi:hypothetical protein